MFGAVGGCFGADRGGMLVVWCVFVLASCLFGSRAALRGFFSSCFRLLPAPVAVERVLRGFFPCLMLAYCNYGSFLALALPLWQ